jgi:hypothetical protein
VLFENLQALLCIAHHIQEDRFVEPQQRGVQQQEFGRRLLLGLRGFSRRPVELIYDEPRIIPDGHLPGLRPIGCGQQIGQVDPGSLVFGINS